MSRIVILGNSHVAALRAAANARPDRFPKERILFFAAPRLSFQQLSFDSTNSRFGLLDPEGSRISKLVQEINGAPSIQIQNDDQVIFYGETAPLHKLMELISAKQIDKFRPSPDKQRLSRAAFEAILDEIVLETAETCYASKFAPRPCHYMLGPMVSNKIHGEDGVSSALPQWARAVNHPDGVSMPFKELRKRLKAALAEKGITFLKQLPRTLADTGLTHERFIEAPETLRDVSETDYRHMNAIYGRITLDHILKQMG